MKNVDIDFMDRSEAGFGKEREEKLLNEIHKNGIKVNSLLFAKNGKIIYEKYFGIADNGRGVDIPNSEYTLNRMFSICKSFTAIAVGLLEDDGKISLTDRIVDYYSLLTGKDLEDGCFDEGIRETTIEDMLTMRTSHSKTTYKVDLIKNWVESFFIVPSDKKPGENFDYDTSAAHVLCALVEKITKMEMLEYIKMKMPELNLSKESYIIKDPFGTSTGGSGLMCTTRDLFRFACLILNKSRIPDFISNATVKKVEITNKEKFSFAPEGYGYFFWVLKNNEYLCYGMQGQFIYFIPDKDMILIITSDCTDNYVSESEKTSAGESKEVSASDSEKASAGERKKASAGESKAAKIGATDKERILLNIIRENVAKIL